MSQIQTPPRGSGGSGPSETELAHLRERLTIELPGEGDLTMEPLAHTAGNSHSIYTLTRAHRRWILRVAPTHRQARVGGAFDLSREAEILAALRDTSIPHAEVVLSAGDRRAPGERDFVVLDYVPGRTLHGPLPDNCVTAADGAALAADIVDVLARIADIDIASMPVRRHTGSFWDAQDRKGRSMRAEFRTRETPLIDELAERVRRARPGTERIGLMHGDYCPLNLRGTVDGPPRVAAVLDWETAGAGDPLVDLGYLTARWVTPDDDPLMAAFTLGGGDPAAHALLPHWTELAERYADVSGSDLADLPKYQGLAMLRLATVLEGRVAATVRRADDGQRAGVATGFATLADTAARRGLTLLESR